MSKVIPMFPNLDVEEGLQYLIDQMWDGKSQCTVILGTEVFHFGSKTDDEAAVAAVWDMTYGIAKLMKAGG